MRQDIIALDADLWERYAKATRVTSFFREIVEKYGDRGWKFTPRFEFQYKHQYTRNEPPLKEVVTFRGKYHMYNLSSNSRELLQEVLSQLHTQDGFT